ncbi:hypothetical protein [Marininema halotolerans]|uniref:Cytosolic protein n=1 Tax=Marininema halotolerans TaxID=1155944 RepID=A0A1I6RMB6_9BACL|nr:hypothetical protein [Marininema halotolerans]SFS65598.1 hypothetical protein SAMN05444972_105185 [Marininema halotolerans]
MRKKKFTDVGTVESQRNDVLPEEFPEGSYGSSRNEATLGKQSPWLSTQHAAPRFTYEMRRFHEGIPRQIPGSHPTHDDPNQHDERSSDS